MAGVKVQECVRSTALHTMQHVPVDKRGPKPDNAPVRIGAAIRRYRIAAGLSQSELGVMINLDQTGVGEIERGERPLPVERLLEIEAVLELDRGALILDAGLVPMPSVESAVLADQKLTPEWRKPVLALYRSAVADASAASAATATKKRR